MILWDSLDSLQDVSVAALLAVNTVAALTVMWTSVCTLNFITEGSQRMRPARRIAYILLGVGSCAMLLAPLYSIAKLTVGGVALLVGLAILLVSERLYSRRLENRRARWMRRNGRS